MIACAGDRGATEHGGTVVIALRAEPEGLFPPLATTANARQVIEVLFDRLALPGPGRATAGDSGFVPQLARRWTWSGDSMSVRFELDPKAKWHDGQPVRAEDIAFSFSLYRDPVVASPSSADLADVDSVTVADSLTAVAWFHARSPLQFNDLVWNLVPVPAHVWRDRPRNALLTDSLVRHPVGNGRFKFLRWDPGDRLIAVADSANARGRPALDRVIWRFGADDATNFARLLAGEVDVFELRTEDQYTRVTSTPSLRAEFFPGFEYGYAQFNLHDGANPTAHPILGDRATRRALAMATDRRALVQNVFGPLAVVGFGPFVRAQFTADTTVAQLPFDLAAARRTLDSLGWRVGADGIRHRGGRALSLSVNVPSGSVLERLAVVLQDQWRAAGVHLAIEPLDRSAFLDRVMAHHHFDVIILSTRTWQSFASLPQSWGSSGARPGGRNLGGYTNAMFDAQVDSALRSLRTDVIRAHLRNAYTTIVDDAPAIFLYEARGAVALHRRFVAPPLRGDGWWLDLPSWSVPRAQRLPRDGPGGQP